MSMKKKVGADEGMHALGFLVHGLAEVIEYPGPLGMGDSETQFGGQDSAASRARELAPKSPECCDWQHCDSPVESDS